MSNTIKSINPYNQELIKTYTLDTEEQVFTKLKIADKVFKDWKNKNIEHRTQLLTNVGNILEERLDTLSELITLEMGKPIQESRAEINKCIFLCDFYTTNAEEFLADQIIKTDASESFISYDPLGVILAIMPWNFPFWQVLRFAIPTLAAGNTVVVKHASNVTGCAMALQTIFEDAGFNKGCYQTLVTNHKVIEKVLEDPIIKAVSLTGSEKAGRSIAKIAGQNLKKAVLELGGNNACIVLDDANLNKYIDTIVKARMLNTGQSCIAAKRFIVTENIYDEFVDKFTAKVKTLKYSNPLHQETEIATLAREDLATDIQKQVDDAIQKGAKVVLGNQRDKAYFAPTILTHVTKNMAVFTEETFGPVAPIFKIKNIDEALELATNSKFGLGTMLFTEDTETATKYISKIPDGAFFINEMVKSDPRLPFGGTKASGYGRELSVEGIHEFVNVKTVYTNK
ncbi:NAD-dependent succinate-semialdehyde dehydrogenase [Lacinutrix sp. C3R15]|uniref:NAD-dependent succinate-semialdehyde dehydrogenase n=1 Tax=Flavobacteriaceae TaxID=49546 RepID=UPI001C0A5612|nr:MULTISPECIES: NAD-dependent succinate-semialdehyde dehydrogenase [Flavobacteriaceae]MBU2940769.1 NAD-dependent succinate-semialdehyde dehydrogenase [Lacinutrix sp. C3R15]MDO6624087.1 NAD-dependent succinate-semialdehyde dehydrogenase [Oceanihabitans sp. 1_MG-2023]